MIECEICGRRFNNKISLSNHRRWHDLPEYKDFQENYRETMKQIMKGKKLSNETKERMSESHKGLKCAENNPNWKGDDVNHRSVHEWIRDHKPKPKVCEICKKKTPKELSNIDHNYKRNIEDYRWLCIECHRNYDNKKFGSYNKPWNKGLPKDEQPMFGRSHSEESKKKMSLTKRRKRRQKLNSRSSTKQKTIEVYES